jgi:hypothetical protein
MKTGDILLFKAEKDFLSWLIAWGTNSKYSHVAVCSSDDGKFIIDARTRGGVKKRKVDEITVGYDIYRIKEGYSYNVTKTITFLESKLNSRYDYFGVAFLGLLKLLAKLGLPLTNAANLWQIKRDYFCSELCYEAFYHGGGLDIVPDVPEADITSPGDIAKSKVVKITT